MDILVIDIGGTNIKHALINHNREVFGHETAPTPKSYTGLMDEVQRIIDSYAFDAVSISIPGVYNKKEDILGFASNLPLDNKPIIRALKSSKPIFVENDAKLATLGEYTFGMDRPVSSMIMVTLGTGVGGGIVINGKLWENNVTSAEIGHMALIAGERLCGCGKKGCFEKFCSAPGILMTYNEISGGSDITFSELLSLAEAADETALKTFEHFSLHLAHGIVSLINLLTPECVRIGGGVSEVSQYYFSNTLRHIDKIVYPAYRGICDVRIARFGNNAALLGGLAMASNGLDAMKS